MKRCARCGETKPLAGFHRHRLRTDGVQSFCKKCRAEIDHERYLRRRGAGMRRNREFERGRVAWLRSLKADRPCQDCGGIYPPEAMQWDHLPGTTKRGDVSTLRGRSREEVLDEIAKCELVCANCHAIRTFQRAGWSLREDVGNYERPIGLVTA